MLTRSDNIPLDIYPKNVFCDMIIFFYFFYLTSPPPSEEDRIYELPLPFIRFCDPLPINYDLPLVLDENVDTFG